MVGRTVLHYSVTAELGAGAMGRVYLARDVLDSLVRCPMLCPDEGVRLHLERGRSLEALRRAAEATAEYREFLRIWRDAEPGRPEVAEAKRALARLARGAGSVAAGRR